MRIACVTETFPPEVNGVALTIERSVRHMRRNGHTVLLVRPLRPSESHVQEADEYRTRRMRIPMYPDLQMGLASVAALKQRFAGFGAELVHVATQGPLGRAAVSAAHAIGVPVTSDFRTNFHLYARHYGFGFAGGLVMQYLRHFHNRTAATFVPCRGLRQELLERGFERVEVMSRGVDASLFTPARRSSALRRQWGAGEGDSVLLYVGRLAAEKNVPLALRAFDAVRRQRPGARLVVVGDGPLRARLQRGRDDVLFAGAQRGTDLAMHYASADVFVFPSLSETFGNVTLEAMAAGLAVVAFDAAAAGELIRDGRNGWLAAPGDDEAFVRAACAAAAGGAALEPLRTRARQTALARDWEPVQRRFERRLGEVALAIHTYGHARLA